MLRKMNKTPSSSKKGLTLSKISEHNNMNQTIKTQVIPQDDNKESRIMETQGKINTPSKLKTTVDTTSRHSVESSFAQIILKSYISNFKTSIGNIYNKFTEEEGCFGCKNISDRATPEVNFKVNDLNYKLIKAAFKTQKEKENLSFNDCNTFLTLISEKGVSHG